MLRSLLLLLGWAAMGLQPTVGQNWEPYFKLFKDEKSEQVNTRNYHLFQDSTGYIWISSANGLKRFDGKTFEYYLFEHQGMAEKGQVVGYSDYRNRLWFIGIGGRITKFQNGILQPFALNDSLAVHLANSRCISFHIDSQEVIHLGLYEKGYLQVHPNGDIIWKISNDHASTGIYYKVIEGEYFVFSLRNPEKPDELIPIYELDQELIPKIRGNLHNASSEPGAGVFGPLRFIRKKNGKLLLSMNQTLVELSKGKKWSYKTRFPMTGLFEDSRGGIWLSSIYRNGVFYSPSGSLSFSEMTLYLDHETIHSITEDRNGGIWLAGGKNGIYHNPTPDFSMLKKSYTDTVWHHKNPLSLAGEMLYGSHKQGYINEFDGQQNISHRLPQAPMETRVLYHNRESHELYWSCNDELWYQKKEETRRIIIDRNGFAGIIRAFALDEDHSTIWVGVASCVYRIENGRVVWKSKSFGHNIWDLAVFNGELYACGRNGLWKHNGKRWLDMTGEHDRLKGMVIDIEVFDDGLWVFNFEKGAAIIKDGDIRSFHQGSNRLPNGVHSVKKADTLWIMGSGGRLNIVTKDTSQLGYAAQLIPTPMIHTAAISESFYIEGGMSFLEEPMKWCID